MRTIEIFRLRRVRDKPAALAAMQAHAGMAAHAALAVLHQAIGGGKPVLCLPDDASARDCITALAPTGFIARFAWVDGFDAAAQAEAAILASTSELPGAVSDAAGALLLAGDWQAALALCVQAAAPCRPDASRFANAQGGAHQRLAQIALEAGVQPGLQGNG